MPKSVTPDDIELRWKALQIEEMEERMEQRRDAKERAAADRKRQLEDFQKNEAIRKRRQALCKHRKGGRNNQFWNGNSNDYSVIDNTYPTGDRAIMCTRCGKEVRKPDRALRKTNPELYMKQWEEWKTWSSFPTDNSPSGSQIFELVANAAA